MGGLIGKLSFEHDEPLARPVLERMLETVRRRRHGAAGVCLAPGIALGGHGEFPCDERADPLGSTEDGTIRRDRAHRLWSLLMLEFWFREFIDGDAAEHPTEYVLLRVA